MFGLPHEGDNRLEVIPGYTGTRGAQLDYPLIAGLSFGRAISNAPPHEHHHDEEPVPLAPAPGGDVLDWDSPASIRYLVPKQFNLPHLKVYSPEGELLFERSGGAEELAAAVGQLLQDPDP